MNFDTKAWIIDVFLIVFITLVVNLVEALLYKHFHPKLKATKNIWDDVFLQSIHKPLGFLIWVVGLSIAIQIVGQQAKDDAIFQFIEPLRDVFVIAIVIWAFIRFIAQTENKVLESKKELDKTTVHAIAQVVRISIVVTGVLVAVQTLGFSISGVLAFGGIGGIAVAFAAKDLLGNFFGGMMIYLDRPFKVGDWIRSPDKNIEGTVEQIGWRLTRIRTFDKRPLYVPNGVFSNISVENPSRMTNRRIRTNVGIRYEDAPKMAVILKDVEAMLKSHPAIETDLTLMVNLVEFGPSSLNFMIYTFTKTKNWVEFQAIQQDVFLKVIEVITNHGAECAFPTTTIHIPENIKVTS